MFLDIFCVSYRWVKSQKDCFYSYRSYKSDRLLEKLRFFRPVASYIVSFEHKYIVFNLYYKTTLETFQDMDQLIDFPTQLFQEALDTKKITKMFFM